MGKLSEELRMALTEKKGGSKKIGKLPRHISLVEPDEKRRDLEYDDRGWGQTANIKATPEPSVYDVWFDNGYFDGDDWLSDRLRHLDIANNSEKWMESARYSWVKKNEQSVCVGNIKKEEGGWVGRLIYSNGRNPQPRFQTETAKFATPEKAVLALKKLVADFTRYDAKEFLDDYFYEA